MKKTIALLFTLLFTLLCVTGCGGEKSVTVQDGRTATPVTVPARATVADILEAAGVSLGEKDEVTPALTEKPADGDVITVARRVLVTIQTDEGETTVELTGGTVADALKAAGITPAADEALNEDENAWLSDLTGPIVLSKLFTVTVKADGKTEKYTSPAQTVAAFLEAQGIEYTKDDRVSPAPKSDIKGDVTVTIQRVTTKTETVKEEIPFETETSYSDELGQGTSETRRQGENGEKEVTYTVTLVDGEEESREITDEKVIKEPVSALVVYGTRAAQTTEPGKTVVSKVAVPDCDGSGHGYYVITYSDGSVEYVDY